MKIDNIKAGQIKQYYQQLKQKQDKAAKNSKNDQIEISSQAKGILTAKAELKSRPQIRTEKVADLKAKLENGNYQIDSKKIAEKMLKNIK
ncbi:MAG: flagellar biosynthesis anti-sigma factor FlgM [Bacillota bacterium]